MAATSTEPGARLDGMKIVHAVCSHDCPDSCGVLVTVDETTGRAVKVQGDPLHPVTRGFLCGKVAKYLDRVYSPDRLLYPMRRRALSESRGMRRWMRLRRGSRRSRRSLGRRACCRTAMPGRLGSWDMGRW